MASICYLCKHAILDKSLLKIGDNFYHNRCVRCSACQCPLNNTCYHRNGEIYCLNDFTLKFGKKCRGCEGALYPSDLVHKFPRGSDVIIYHVACLRCSVCACALTTDCELCFTTDRRVVCRDDYVTESDDSSSSNEHCANNTFEIQSENVTQPDDVIPPFDISCDVISNQQNHSDISMEDFLESKMASPAWLHSDVITDNVTDDVTAKSETDFDAFSNHSPTPEKTVSVTGSANQKRRGPRTTIKAKQLDTLKSAFASTPKPTRHIREQLAQDTGLTMRVIQVWFQNRRSKERRMKQMNVLGNRRHFYDRSVPGVLIRESIEQSDCLVANTRVQQQYYSGIEQPLPRQTNFSINYTAENIHGIAPEAWTNQIPVNMTDKDNSFHQFNPLMKNIQHNDSHSTFYNANQQGYNGGVNF